MTTRNKEQLGNFGAGDYWRMLRARGIRLPIQYFFQTHLFDLVRGTDTHTWLPRDRYIDPPAGEDHGGYYMCSLTNIVRKAFRVTERWDGGNFKKRVFVDVGSGKGKVVFAWKECLEKSGISQQTIGLEYYGPLVRVAKANQRKLGIEDLDLFREADAASFDYRALGDQFLLYMYNPFDDSILSAVLDQLDGLDVIVVHTYLDHQECMSAAGFEVFHRSGGWYPGSRMTIYHRGVVPPKRDKTQGSITTSQSVAARPDGVKDSPSKTA